MDQADGRLVSVFKTSDPGVLPLATMALDAEGIEYSVRSAGKADTMQWAMSQPPTNRPVVMEILVTSDVASRARDLVIDLERGSPTMSVTDPGAIPESVEAPTVRLEEASTGRAIGTITEAQLQEVTAHLEEDAPQHYFVDEAAIDTLKSAHADPALVSLLRQAVDQGDGLMIRWTI